MNQGRVTASAATLPVLTGTPVAGMAYLDRPKQAGYFIFPDLSVRHEGKYRLSFNLYEELKEPEKDADPATPEGSPAAMGAPVPKSPSSSRNYVHFRLEVKSGPFSVFSAKKFPGLAESTSLSRLVNEQGCRVRIRRDVRMRRRDKMSDNYPDAGDDSSYPQQDRYQTPQQAPDRPRSLSNTSLDISTPYSTERRPSVHEVGYYQATNYQQHPPPPPQSASSYNSHLSFGGSNTPHYQTPTMHAPSHAPPLSQYQQPPNAYTYPPPSHGRHMSGPQNYGYPCQPPQQATYVPPAYMDERPLYPDSRRSSGGMTMGRQQPSVESYVHNHPAMQAHSSSQPMRSLTPVNTNPVNQCPPSLPPIKSLTQYSPHMSTCEPKSSASAVPPGPQNPFSTTSYTPLGYHGYGSSTPRSSTPGSTTQSKRPFGSAFDASHQNHPMHGGQRPSVALQAQDLPQMETQDGEVIDINDDTEEMRPLVYKRADGRKQAKNCPGQREG